MNIVNDCYRFLKEKHLPLEGSHDIYTPQLLVENTLSKLNLSGNILVLYNLEFVFSLIYTYNIKPENITMLSDHINKNKMLDRFGVTYITTLGTTMKFDVVLGNPPYQDNNTGNSTKTTNLYAPIVTKALKLCNPSGILSMIIPSDWIGPNPSTFKTSIFNNRNVREISLHPYQKYFKVKKGTCNIIIDKTYIGDCLVEDELGNSELIDLRSTQFLSTDNSNIKYREIFINYPSMQYRWLRGKLNINKIVFDETGVEFIAACGRKDSPLDIKLIPANLEQTGAGLHKIVMPNVGGVNGDLGNNLKIAEPHQVGGHSVVFLTTNSKIESENLLTYLNTTPIKSLIKSVKKSSPNSKIIFNQIPDVDLSTPWDDNRVYNYFNFTPEDIQYAESL